jgi:hypothetical protein
MVQENDVIAIIIIILFAVLALIAFGIYRLVSIARAGSNSSSSGQTSLADGDDWEPVFSAIWRCGRLTEAGGTAHELMGLDGMGEIASDCIITIYARRILLD